MWQQSLYVIKISTQVLLNAWPTFTGSQIRHMIDHKVLTIVYHCLNNEAPEYLKDLLNPLPGGRKGLRSVAQYQRLLVPFIKFKTFAERSFSIRDPKLWNALLNHIKQACNTDIFKKTLKTYLYRKSYNLNS